MGDRLRPLRTSRGGTHPVDTPVLCSAAGDRWILTGHRKPGFVLEPYPLARTVAGVPATATSR